MTQLLERPVVAPTVDPSTAGPTEMAHLVNCPADKESAEAWLTEARVYGLEVTALCGYRWIPERDPARFPICPACVEAAGIILAEEFGEGS